MTTNRLLLNINRNATAAERFMMQLTSGKRIHNPSDDPIIASRALRFRTNVSEVEQFQRNAAQATSWMEVTEGAMSNMQSIKTTINTRLVQAATGTYTIGQRQTIAAEIDMFFRQMNSEMNTTFAGRYVFSGFRTDRPPIITNDTEFSGPATLTHDLRAQDLEVLTQIAWWDGPPANAWEFNAYPNDPTISAINVLDEPIHKFKLPYSERDGRTMSIPVIELFDAAGVSIGTITPISMSLTGPDNPYTWAQINDVAVFIPETGEIILPQSDVDDVRDAARMEVVYEIDRVFEGELNPFVFFHTEYAGDTFTVGDQELRFELGTNVRIAVNSQANDAYPWQFFADLMSLQLFVNKMDVPPNLTEQEAIEHEAFFRESLYQKFTNMISSMEGHIQHSATEYTTMGSRMNRVELISNRLMENRDTFTELMSENENIDFIEVMMRFNAAEAIFQAAMQVGARISQISIVNFL
jgi:flagellar hook-associated protein 3 FlgL